MSHFNYKVRYLKGADNSVADILSRLVSVPEQNRRTDEGRSEIMGSLATLITSEIPSVRNALLGGYATTDIEEPHETVETLDYQASDLDFS
eukprot:SAG11_NODE_25703_length_355_cov_0.792969_2_plen_90_part_01